MKALMAVVTPLYWLNGALLRVGSWIGVLAIAAMVVAILVQVQLLTPRQDQGREE